MQIVFPCATILLLPVLVLIHGYKRLEFQPALGQVALKFYLSWVSTRFLINDLVGRQLGDPLPIQQVEMRSYLPIRKTYSSLLGGERGLVVGRWTCIPEVPGSNPPPCL